jgi:spermidine synthase
VKSKPAPSQVQPLGTPLRRYLYFTAAVTGAAILIVEILGAKMLSPYVGTSHFVWTAQIAVTLVSLATGYYFGGWLVDRSQKLGRLYLCILFAAIYLCFAVLVCEKVAYACLQYKLAVGALLTSAALFFVPLTLLATTGPFLVRVLTSLIAGVGGLVGRLSAISTLGSVIGTVLIGYALIPYLPNSITMFLTASFLMAIAAGYFLIWGKKDRPTLTLSIGALAGLAMGYGGLSNGTARDDASTGELYRGNSNFGLVQVLEHKNSGRRFYLNDYLIQNTYDPTTKQSGSMFTYMLHGLARAYNPQINDVLCIGLGIGIVPMQFASEGVRVDVVEINPAVVPVAARFFDLQPGQLNISLGDGRYFLNQCTSRYDVIVLDAFLGDSSPSHLMTKEAFGAMRRVLRRSGVLVINSFGDFQTGEDFFTASLEKTLKSVFRSVRIHSEGNGNVFFVASDETALKVPGAPDLLPMHPSVRAQVKLAFERITQTNPAHGRVLTDDFNPVEYYDAVNREMVRRQLAISMRKF